MNIDPKQVLDEYMEAIYPTLRHNRTIAEVEFGKLILSDFVNTITQSNLTLTKKEEPQQVRPILAKQTPTYQVPEHLQLEEETSQEPGAFNIPKSNPFNEKKILQQTEQLNKEIKNIEAEKDFSQKQNEILNEAVKKKKGFLDILGRGKK